MMQINTKRCLSLMLALVLTLSFLPVSGLATENEEVTETVAVENTVPMETTEAIVEIASVIQETTVPVVIIEETAPIKGAAPESEALKAVQTEIDRILDYYEISLTMTVEEITSAVNSMETMTYREALYEIIELEETEEMQSLTDAEFQILEEENKVFFAFAQALNDRYAQDDSINLLSSASKTAMDGQVSISASDPTWTTPSIAVDGSSITVSIYSSTSLGDYTTNVTITNNSSDKVLSFEYHTDGNANTEIDTTPVLNLMPGDTSDAIALRVKGRRQTAFLYIDITEWETIQATATVKFVYDTADVTVDGVSVGGSGAEKSISSTDGATVNATGSNFVGWINTADNSIISSAANFKLTPPKDMTIKPIYGPTARFEIDKTYLFEDFSSAVTFATANGKSTIALANNGTLTDSITVPAGITLLIPYDDARTLCTTTPYVNKDSSYKKPSAYRTLTMSAGSSIIVNGALSLSGEACTKMGSNSCPMGPLSFITMASNSNITINNGGKLYAWGYITGSGTVTVESGGITYENFQLKDWRGGEGALSMINNNQKVFPVSQYYVQNVEVPMEFKQGASAKGYLVIVASSTMQSAEVPFIGTGSMFVVGGTSLVKDYIESTDRLQVEINGNLSMSSLQISLDSYNMDSNSYTLPITNNLTVNINSGTTTISQDMAILPGAEITVAENATLILSSGKSVYVYDMDTWSGYVYNNLNCKPLTYANKGTPATRSALADAKITVNGTLDASGGYLYTSSGGANICSEGNGIVITTPGTSTVTYQATQKAVTETILGFEYTKQEITYHEIPITPAKLKNGDSSYTETATDGTGTYKYSGTGENGRWILLKQLTYTNIKAGDCLDIFFYTDLYGEGYKAKVTRERANEAGAIIYSTEYIPASQWSAYGNNQYRFAYQDIAAKEMSDTVTVTIYDEHDRQLTHPYSESVEGYAVRALKYYAGKTDMGLLQTALVDMLNYGAAAQSHFKNYRIDVYANRNIDSYQDFATADVTYENKDVMDENESTYKLYGTTLTAESEVYLTFYFTGITAENKDSMSATAEYTTIYGKKVKQTIQGSDFNSYTDKDNNTTYYGPCVTGIAAADGKQTVSCTLNYGTGTTTVKSDIESYVARTIGETVDETTLDKLCLSLMKFVVSAKAYFESTMG